MQFSNIKHIDVEDKKSWEDKLFLTFDIDWASDEVLSYTLNIIERYSLKATFFITHETQILKKIRDNPNIEIGIHPNFNPLLNGDFNYGRKISEVIEHFMRLAPEAISVRSHSMAQSTPILDTFAKYGLRYDVNHFVPFNADIELRPWNFWNQNLIKVPYFWEDDVHCIYALPNCQDVWNITPYLNRKGLKVFDFHPIHIFLNTEDMQRYENSKKCNDVQSLYNYRNTQEYGVHDFLINLIEEALK